MLICGRRSLVDEIKPRIMKRWISKNLGLLEKFALFQVKRDRLNHSILIHQEIYVKKLLKRLGIKNFDSVSIPLALGTVLEESKDDRLLYDENAALYRQIVGSTIYLSNDTRPDISSAVGQLARVMSKPRLSFLNHAKLFLRYLQRISNFDVPYSLNRQHEFMTYP